jgi:ligand-binding sensor domain-containing protein/AraC-like DNA-binding protein
MKLFQLKTLLFALLVLTSHVNVSAQLLQAKLSHYSTDDGLASNSISHLLQDDYGYIWISTWNGLSRFDGYHFYNYQTGAGSRIPNLHNRVRDILIDNQQNVWMLMYDGRVFVMKRSIDTIINPFEDLNESDELRFDFPIMSTSTGEVIFNAGSLGLYKMSFEGDHVKSQLITTNGLTITAIAEGYQNDIWLGTDKGVHRMDLSNQTVENKGYFLDEHVTALFSNGYNVFVGTQSGKILSFSYGQEPSVIRTGGESVTGLFVDSHGFVWFSDVQPGVLRIIPGQSGEKRFIQTVLMPDYDGGSAEFAESNGIVWMRMNRGGYGYYNRETDMVEYFHNDPSNTWNLSNTINARMELSEGVVWESTKRQGLEKLEILSNTIERVSIDPDKGPSPTNEIRALFYDTRKQLTLIGNKAGDLFTIDHEGNRHVIKNTTGESFGRIYGISQDRAGNYWLSCKGTGLYQLKKETNGGYDIRHYSEHDNGEWSLNDNRCYQSVEDADGNIWIATYGSGVNILTRNKSGKPMFLNLNNAMKNYPANMHHKVRTVALDANGNVWAGTTDGILIMSYKNRKITIQQLEPSEEHPTQILMSNDVVCMAQDRNGEMWVGTSGGGLSHTIGKDSQGRWLFETFGVEDGLPSEEVRSITFDHYGNVWFSTDHVLYSFDTDKRIFTTFSTLDGVDDTTCSEGAALSLPNGNVLFGTVNGYYVVDRSKLETSAGSVLKLRITDFWINDELQTPRKDSPISYYVPDAKSVELPHHSDIFSFRFASLNYHLQHRVHYQYMLEGYDKNWQNADKQRMATYSGLPTGSYRFKVKAFLLESPDKYDLKQIEVVVPPYYLFSTNAIWLYMFISMVLGIWLMFRRQKRLEKEEKLRLLREGPRERKVEIVNNDFMIFLNEYLSIHFSDPMLTVEDIAQASDQTEEEFAATLYKFTKQLPKAYILDYRLKRAVEMLETTDMSVAEIAHQCGYVDPSAFMRQFKTKTGVMPSRYRDIHKKAGI